MLSDYKSLGKTFGYKNPSIMFISKNLRVHPKNQKIHNELITLIMILNTIQIPEVTSEDMETAPETQNHVSNNEQYIKMLILNRMYDIAFPYHCGQQVPLV